MFRNVPARGRALAGAVLVAGFSFLPALGVATLVPEPGKKHQGCAIAPLSGVEPGHVLTDSMAGSILFHTTHAVDATGLHRGWRGLRERIAVLEAVDDRAAREVLKARMIDYIAVCPAYSWPHEMPGSLRQRLIDGMPPPWLRKVAGDGITELNVFQVEKVTAPPDSPASPPPPR